MTVSAGVVPVFRPGIHEKDRHDLFLLLRVYNYWDFPKGELNPDEKNRDGAIRECREETGIVDLKFDWGDEFYQTQPYSKNKIARYFVARVLDPSVKLMKNPVTGIIEHHEFRWCSESEASKLLGARVGLVLEWAVQQIATN